MEGENILKSREKKIRDGIKVSILSSILEYAGFFSKKIIKLP